jgi:hypothetical protein
VSDLNLDESGQLPVDVSDQALRERVSERIRRNHSYEVDRSIADLIGIEHADRAPPLPLFASGGISLGGVRIELEHVEWTNTHLTLEVRVPDRNTGTPRPLKFNVNYAPCYTQEQLAESIVKAIANVIAHEVAEMLFINGTRFDRCGSDEGEDRLG